MPERSTHLRRVLDPSSRWTRRGLAGTIASGLMLLPGAVARAQTDFRYDPNGRDEDEEEPTIEPMDDDDVIQPDEYEEPAEPEQPVEEEQPVEDEQPIEQTTPEDGAYEVDYSDTRYFAARGHNLSDRFLAAWTHFGGEAVLGVPLSEARYVTGAGVQQAFQAVTLMYDAAENAETESPVRVMAIDPDVVVTLAPESARRSASQGGNASRFFSETGHGISGDFLELWDELGGESFLGRPLSETFVEAGITLQLFENGMIERARNAPARLRFSVELDQLTDVLLADPAFAAAPPNLGITTLVTADDGLFLRGEPAADGETRVVIAMNAEFIAAPGDHGEWVPGYADGYSGWVAAEYLKEPDALPTIATSDWDVSVWQGATLGETNVRSQPSTSGNPRRTIAHGESVTVVEWVEGEAVEGDDDCWARLEDGSYLYVRNVARNAPVVAPPVPNDAPQSGKWIDVHLTQQLMVAYDGREVQRVVVMTSGRPGWSTPAGMFAINHRVANETMDSGSIGAESFYKLEDVLFTQYFTDRGHALHFAWWKTAETIGRPGSHGCLNLLLDDARFFWDWATIGTPVYCHT